MPGFTNSDFAGGGGGDGPVVLDAASAATFSAQWTEGTYVRSSAGFSGSRVDLTVLAGKVLSAGQLYAVLIDGHPNRIGSQCSRVGIDDPAAAPPPPHDRLERRAGSGGRDPGAYRRRDRPRVPTIERLQRKRFVRRLLGDVRLPPRILGPGLLVPFVPDRPDLLRRGFVGDAAVVVDRRRARIDRMLRGGKVRRRDR